MQSDSAVSAKRTFSKIRNVSIIGAGVMGREIASASVQAGIPVTISDVDSEIAAEAVRQIRKSITSATLRGPHFLPHSAGSLISHVSSETPLADAELVIEAVPEDESLKTEILTRVESSLAPHTILASNSSSIPITRLASGLRNPGRMCGLHFCHPVSERPLVEVIRTNETSSDTVRRIEAYARVLGLAPVVLGDRPGFLLNRLLVPYLNEALELLLEGAAPESLEQAARDFGFPMGSLRHIDEFGIDVALAVGRTLYRAFPERIVPSELLIAMYKAGWYGRKSAGGFYRVDQSGNWGELRPEVLTMIEERRRTSDSPSSEVVSRRLFLPLLLEALRAWEESFVEDPRTVDLVLKNGLGMTSNFRGLWNWADAIGSTEILKSLETYAVSGRRFEPTPRLREIASRNGSLQDSFSAVCHDSQQT